MKRRGTKRTPGNLALFNASASLGPSTHGAPTTSNGVSVPRPTETLVGSSRQTPGYKVASVRLRMFGEGLTHVSPVESNHCERFQSSTRTTKRSALMLRTLL